MKPIQHIPTAGIRRMRRRYEKENDTLFRDNLKLERGAKQLRQALIYYAKLPRGQRPSKKMEAILEMAKATEASE